MAGKNKLKNFRVSATLLAEFEAICVVKGITYSELIRTLMVQYVEANKKYLKKGGIS